MAMTGIERMTNFFKRKPMDRIPVYEHFWSDTRKIWSSQGNMKPDEEYATHFDFDIIVSGGYNTVADLDYVPETLDETEDTRTFRNGNGSVFKVHKKHDSTPEHMGFACKTSDDWYNTYKPMITPDSRRLDIPGYLRVKEIARKENRFFTPSFAHVFEQMKDIVGHETMLVGMALEPEWISDMAMTYAKQHVALQEQLFAAGGKPDGIWYYEDMGFKQRPFMSPAMYDEIVKPAHKYTLDFAKSLGLPVIMHSCGFVEPLLPGMIEAGIDALQVLEIKAGMDPFRIQKNFGDRLSIMGGIDVRTICSNDRKQIDAELEAKVPALMKNYGFALHSDHSIPSDVEYDNFVYYLEKGRALGTY